VVSGGEVHKDVVIVLSGNLTVRAGGNLTLINCTLLLNCTYDGECWIIVEEGGTLNVLGGSTITAYDPKHEFFFLVLGRLIMQDSTLSECGFNSTYMGLLLYTDEGVLLENVTITKCYYGVSTYKLANITVRGCEIVGNEEYGIVCYKSSDMLIENVTITRCYYGISICKSTNVTIGDCEIVGNEEDSIQCDQSSDILISSCVIGNSRKRLSTGLWLCCSSSITISNCVVSRNEWGVVLTHCNHTSMVGCEVSYNGDWGVDLFMCSDVKIVNCTIAHNFDGMEVLGYNITIYGCSIRHNDYWGLVCEGGDIEVYYCNICYNGDWGLMCDYCEDVEVHYCNIYSNGDVGLYNFADALVNATYCWWHSPSGPEYKRKGDPHNPEEVYSDYGREYLAYEPWLTEPWMPPDEEPPDVVFIEPENGSYVRGSITVRAEASDNEAIDRVEFYANATLLSRDYEAPLLFKDYKCEWNTTTWPDGLYVLEAIAYDGVGNSNRTAMLVVVDNTPPTICLVRHMPEEPAEDQEVTVEANVSDVVSGLDKVVLWYRANNGAWTGVEMVCLKGVWMATIPGQSASSEVEYYVKAWDKAGNTVRSSIMTYQVKSQQRAEPSVAWAVVVAAVGAATTVMAIYSLRRRR